VGLGHSPYGFAPFSIRHRCGAADRSAAPLRPYNFSPFAIRYLLSFCPFAAHCSPLAVFHHSPFAIRHSPCFTARRSPLAIRRPSPFAIRWRCGAAGSAATLRPYDFADLPQGRV
jgi:hypothetical protein